MPKENIALKSIVKTEAELKEMGYGVQNNIIEYVNINNIGHFGNSACLEIILRSAGKIFLLPAYGSPHHI